MYTFYVFYFFYIISIYSAFFPDIFYRYHCIFAFFSISLLFSDILPNFFILILFSSLHFSSAAFPLFLTPTDVNLVAQFLQVAETDGEKAL